VVPPGCYKRKGHQEFVGPRGLQTDYKLGMPKEHCSNYKIPYLRFEWIYFSHILIEINAKADELFKEALPLPIRGFGYYEFIDGEDI